jgi:hypothetical protein
MQGAHGPIRTRLETARPAHRLSQKARRDMTTSSRFGLAVLAVLCSAATGPAGAVGSTASSAASSASNSLATSSGSSANSLQGSSGSSTNTTGVAGGDYRVIEVTTVAERPGAVRMKLQAVADTAPAEREFYLFVPQAVADGTRLAAGATVTARHRAYGLEFAQGDTRQPFFLVLADDWVRELQSHPVQS